MSGSRTIYINRAPVLTLWAAVVAEQLGFRRDEALTLGRAVAGLNAYSKGVSLGLFRPSPKSVIERRKRLTRGRRLKVDVLRRAVPVVRTPDGLRALSGGRPISPTSVQRYLQDKFGKHLTPARAAMRRLARSVPPKPLAANGYALYVKFRPGDRRQGLGCQRQPRSDRDSAPDQTKPITAVTVGAPRPVNSLTKCHLLASCSGGI
jgi:hypothetical protein